MNRLPSYGLGQWCPAELFIRILWMLQREKTVAAVTYVRGWPWSSFRENSCYATRIACLGQSSVQPALLFSLGDHFGCLVSSFTRWHLVLLQC